MDNFTPQKGKSKLVSIKNSELSAEDLVYKQQLLKYYRQKARDKNPEKYEIRREKARAYSKQFYWNNRDQILERMRLQRLKED